MTDAPARLLSWDTEFFGVRVGRVVGHDADESRLLEIEAWCAENEIDVLYFLAELDPATTRAAEEHGFHQVDLRITLERSLADAPVKRLEPLSEDALPLLVSTARVAHQDSRFFADHRFDRARCEALYVRWLEKGVRGELDRSALGVEVAGEPAGYITVGVQGETGSIGLIAVREAARGRGVGSELVCGALAEAVALGCTRMEVVTQGRNIEAQRLYQKHGFRTSSIRAWYHRWFT